MNIFKNILLYLLMFLLVTTNFLFAQTVVRIDLSSDSNKDLLESLNLNLCFEMEDFIVVAVESTAVLETRNIPFTLLTRDIEAEPLFIVTKGMRVPLESRSYVGEIVINEGSFRVERVLAENIGQTTNSIEHGESLRLTPVKVNDKVFYRNRITQSNFQNRGVNYRNILNQVNGDSIAWFMQNLEDFHSRHAFNANRWDLSQWIADQFIRFGFNDVVQDTFFASSWNGSSWQSNVVATMVGSTYPDSYVIIGAHHDSITNAQMSNPNAFAPGSNDNASGVAAVLEIARILSLHPGQPQYSIRFVTLAKEEFGLHGAYHDANKMISEGKNVIAMLNSDMISYSAIPNWQFRLIRYPGSEFLTNLGMELGQELGMSMSNTTQWNQQSDSWAYHSVGIPSIFFHIGDDDPYYHTTNDLFIHQNIPYTEQYVKLITLMSMIVSEVNTFEYDLEATTISGLVGMPINSPATFTIGLKNNGLNPADGYNVQLMQLGNNIPLATAPGIFILPEESDFITINWTPTSLGEYKLFGRIDWELDEGQNNNDTDVFTVRVIPEGTAEAYIGNPNSNAALNNSFVNFNSRDSITQTIYYQNELPFGNIYQMTVRFTGAKTLVFPGCEINIYMATTDKMTFTSNSDWIPSNHFTLVYSGDLAVYEEGTYEIEIVLDTPYRYDNGNLVVMAVKDGEIIYGSENAFQFTPIEEQARTIWWRSNMSGPPIIAPLPTAIGLLNGVTNARFALYTHPLQPPTNLSIIAQNGVVTLNWEHPMPRPNSYKIFRDDVFINEITEDYYIDEDILPDSFYYYGVKAIYENGESEISMISVIVPVFNPPINLEVDEKVGEIVLSWEAPQPQKFGSLMSFMVYRDDEPFEVVVLNSANILNQKSSEYLSENGENDKFSFIDNDIIYYTQYTYFVTAIWGDEINGESDPSNIVTVTPEPSSDYEQNNLPLRTELLGNIPNPFNPDTLISFTLETDSIVQLEVFNIRGQKIKTLLNTNLERGIHHITWNGTDENGINVGSGIYFYRMQTNEFSDIKRMVLLK